MTELSKYLDININLCIGGTDLHKSCKEFNNGVHVVVGTPGRIYDLINRNILKLDNLIILYNFEESVKDGIRYNELDSIDPKKQNEMFPKSFVFKIPILRELITASQRIADASLNVARYELYNKYKRELLRKGITRESDPNEYEQMAKLVMNSTGSGNMLEILESRKAEKVMGSLYYGARLMAANMNTLNPIYYVRMPKEVRKMAMKDLASYATTVIATTLAFAAAGGAVSNSTVTGFWSVIV
jgi:hypothetical protein